MAPGDIISGTRKRLSVCEAGGQRGLRQLDEGSKHGTAWQDDELDAIVADYFVMLNAELAGEAYVKSRHSSAMMADISRTHRSVEFKYQNISAVLAELGIPWIPGYKPKENYQGALFSAVNRYLSTNPSVLLILPETPKVLPESSTLFVPPPEPVPLRRPASREFRTLLRKFDPAERDLRNRSLGSAGEAFVLDVERKRLFEADRNDLAKKVRWVAAEDGDGAGYDILSYEASGAESLIEVKTTNGVARTPFFLTNNEREMARERPLHWRIYRVHLFARDPKIFTLCPPLENSVLLRAETWRASFHVSAQ